MDIAELMRRLAASGVTAILKADHERFASGGDYWTIVISGGALGADGLIRAEENSLRGCLQVALTRLRARCHEWDWVADFTPS